MIQFRAVTKKYKNNSYALKNINLDILSGEFVFIVGASGAGKSTLMKLLYHEESPTSGTVTIGGINIANLSNDKVPNLRRCMGIVFQDYKLFAFTLKENICFDHEENDENIIDILQKNGMGDKIVELDKGIHTSVYKTFDENGFEPSGGEGQKIALARAIYKDAPIILLDEPTSALDPKAENELYQNFYNKKKKKTAVFISHRMSSTRFCDRIILFQAGKIIETGTHEKLMAQKGKYYELFQMQAQYYVKL